MKYVPKTKPFRHQVRATLRAVKHRNYALFMEPRTGKTKAALDAVGILALKGEVQRVLVLCPKIALDVWDDQIKEHFPYEALIETHDEEWSYDAQGEGLTVAFYLIGYERFRWRRRSKSRWRYPYGEEVEQWDPDYIICDESHRLKRAGGVTAQFAWRMVSRRRRHRREPVQSGLPNRPYVLLLSGTPNPKGWLDLFAQFRVLDDTIFGTNQGDFVEDHVVYGTGPLQYTILKFRNVRRIERAVKQHAYTCTADEAGLAGKVFFQSLRCELPPTARRTYNEVAEEWLTLLESGTVIRAANPGVKRLRLAQITGGFTTDGEEIHHAKLDTAGEYLDLLRDQGEKVVIYATYLPEVHALEALALKMGFTAASIYGGTKDRDRRTAIRSFQSISSRGAARRRRPTLDCLVFQVQSGSVSIELSAAAEVLYYSTPDGWENYYGSYHRVLGPNQKRPVRVTHLIAPGTVDVSRVYNLQNKEDAHRTLYKDPRRYLYGLLPD